MAIWVTSSVSNLGINTPGPTLSSIERNGALPVMCCSGSRLTLREISGSRSLRSRASPVRAIVRSSPRETSKKSAKSTSLSASKETMPAASSRLEISAIASVSRFGIAKGREPCLFVHLDSRFHNWIQSTVHHLVKVVSLVAGAVVGDSVFWEVVGADALRAVNCADLALSCGRLLGVNCLLLEGQKPCPEHTYCSLTVLQLALLVLH